MKKVKYAGVETDGLRGMFVYTISGIILFNFFILMWVSKLWLMLWYNQSTGEKILGVKYHRCGIWEWKRTPDSDLSGFSEPTHSGESLPPNSALHKCWLCHYAVFQKLHHYMCSLKSWRKAKYWSFLWICTKRVYNWVLPIKAHFHTFSIPLTLKVWARREGEIICKARFKQVLNRSRQLVSDTKLVEFLGKKLKAECCSASYINNL